jgi:hypothetical protein
VPPHEKKIDTHIHISPAGRAVFARPNCRRPRAPILKQKAARTPQTEPRAGGHEGRRPTEAQGRRERAAQRRASEASGKTTPASQAAQGRSGRSGNHRSDETVSWEFTRTATARTIPITYRVLEPRQEQGLCQLAACHTRAKPRNWHCQAIDNYN